MALSRGSLSLQRLLSSALSPRKPPATCSKGGQDIPTGAQAPGELSEKKVIPGFVPKTCLPGAPRLLLFALPNVGCTGHIGPPGTSPQNSSQCHVAPPGLHLFTQCPRVGPTQPARPCMQPPGEAWLCLSQGERPSHGLLSLAGPVGASLSPRGLGKMPLEGRTLEITHRKQKTLS